MAIKLNSSKVIYTGRVYKLIRENITLPNQVRVDLEVIRHPGASGILALTDQREVVMVRQYRHAIGDFIWEIPAGTLDTDESRLSCAKRELQEETGFSARSWQKLGEIVPVPGYSDERISLYLATQLFETAGHPEQDEYLSVHLISFDHVMKMIYQGDICDAKTISAVFMAAGELETNPNKAACKKGSEP